MSSKIAKTIGIIDSGIGGLAVLKMLIKKFGVGNYIYFADNLFMPYGNKSKQFVEKRVSILSEYMLNKLNVDLVVIACNTASSCIGKHDERILTLKFFPNRTYFATKLTKKNVKNCNVISDSNLAFLIEKYIGSEKINYIIKRKCCLHNLTKYQEIVLGCTHFELLKSKFENFAKNTHFLLNSFLSLSNLTIEGDDLNIEVLTSKNSKKYYNLIWRIIKDNKYIDDEN